MNVPPCSVPPAAPHSPAFSWPRHTFPRFRPPRPAPPPLPGQASNALGVPGVELNTFLTACQASWKEATATTPNNVLIFRCAQGRVRGQIDDYIS